jgi:hypothetical protein
MTRDEIVDLLTAIAAYDKRKPDPTAVLAWGEAASRGRWTLPEALEAVHSHFSESTEYLMPGHITQRVRDARRDRQMRDAVRAIEPPPPRPEIAARVDAAAQHLADRLGWKERETRARDHALTVGCPHCRALPGERCVQPRTRRPLTKSPCHPACAAAAQQQQGVAS